MAQVHGALWRPELNFGFLVSVWPALVLECTQEVNQQIRDLPFFSVSVSVFEMSENKFKNFHNLSF